MNKEKMTLQVISMVNNCKVIAWLLQIKDSKCNMFPSAIYECQFFCLQQTRLSNIGILLNASVLLNAYLYILSFAFCFLTYMNVMYLFYYSLPSLFQKLNSNKFEKDCISCIFTFTCLQIHMKP